MSSNLTLLVVLAGLVAGLFVLGLVEASLLHLRRSEVVIEAEGGDRRARHLLRLLDDLPRVMNAVLLAVLLAQVTAATISGVLARRWFGGNGLTAATVAVTLLVFVYGEAIPKTLAIRRPYPIARRLAPPVRWLSIGLRPLVSVLVWVADVQAPGKGVDTVTAVSEQELLHLTDEAASAGRIEQSDAELVEKSFTLGDLLVAQILVPRADVVAVAAQTPVEDALRTAIGAGHRRLPVFDGHLDNIVGFVRLRDLADATTTDADAVVADRVRRTLSAPESMLAVDLLRSMQKTGHHLAVVVDDAGATRGIVTIEDVVEELVGTIEDR